MYMYSCYIDISCRCEIEGDQGAFAEALAGVSRLSRPAEANTWDFGVLARVF